MGDGSSEEGPSPVVPPPSDPSAAPQHREALLEPYRSAPCARFEAPADLSERARRLTGFIERMPGLSGVPPTVEHVLRVALINGLAQLEREVKRIDPVVVLSGDWPREPMRPAPLTPPGGRGSRVVEAGPPSPGGMQTPLMVRVDNPFEEEELALGMLQRRPLRPAPPRRRSTSSSPVAAPE